jgi:uncharacterized protein YnzC (UPF0291/DUF896 family)
MNGQVQFVTNEKGEQTGVLLDIEHYYRLVSENTIDPELLVGLSIDELEALAETKLAINQQSRLNELLAKQKADGLSDEEVQEIDRLLAYVDQLTILKARAMYTLNKMSVSTSSK